MWVVNERGIRGFCHESEPLTTGVGLRTLRRNNPHVAPGGCLTHFDKETAHMRFLTSSALLAAALALAALAADFATFWP